MRNPSCPETGTRRVRLHGHPDGAAEPYVFDLSGTGAVQPVADTRLGSARDSVDPEFDWHLGNVGIASNALISACRVCMERKTGAGLIKRDCLP